MKMIESRPLPAPPLPAARLTAYCSLPTGLPGTLRDARNVAFEGQLPEAQAAHRELAHVGPRSTTQPATVTQPNFVLRRLVLFGDLCCRCHSLPACCAACCRLIGPERHAHQLEQLSRLFIRPGGRQHGHVHST